MTASRSVAASKQDRDSVRARLTLGIRDAVDEAVAAVEELDAAAFVGELRPVAVENEAKGVAGCQHWVGEPHRAAVLVGEAPIVERYRRRSRIDERDALPSDVVALGAEVWIAEWRAAGPGRTVRIDIYGERGIGERTPELFVLPPWGSARTPLTGQSSNKSSTGTTAGCRNSACMHVGSPLSFAPRTRFGSFGSAWPPVMLELAHTSTV